MPFLKSKVSRSLFSLAMLFFAWLVLLESDRATARILIPALIISSIQFIRIARTKWMRLIFVAFLIAAFLPVDVRLRNLPGPPRLVPLIMGSPTDEDVAREARGEVVLGGCISRGNEPRWVWVW